ncbi:hypothetical protein fugu_003875 [Takifugu bimaculatus]|uniref:RILP-like protein 1 n=1 Tax=Takifugu bimaculatus TaxID=433685 RepID=A0A4Z2BB38_9TELE|nr:hypothetical protein fugu_003875 [Takifugu bimaculatus]
MSDVLIKARTDMETHVSTPLDRAATELTIMDVYDIAAVLGHEFERVIDRFGCEPLVGLVHKVVRVLELLEALVSRGGAAQEADELRRELDRLRQERSDRFRHERKHQKELESVEDVWRGEVQDLLSQISQLQAENKRLLKTPPLKEPPIHEEEPEKQEGSLEKEQQIMKTLKDLVDKQRDEIRAKDHELTSRNEDVEALQMQQSRLIRVNQDLRHRVGAMEARGKVLIQQKADLEAAAQAQQQELGTLQQQVARLRKELQGWELEREVANVLQPSPAVPEPPVAPSPETQSPAAAAESNSPIQARSVWVECGSDPSFVANCYEPNKTLYLLPNGDATAERLLNRSTGGEQEEDKDSLEEEESGKARFTLQELRDVLHERNELKAQVFVLQEELTYYKSEEAEEELNFGFRAPSPPPCTTSTDRPESGIRRLLFTAIMPMVAAGWIADDPTLLPIRRLLSSV